jgi:hypothetical protein
MEFVYRNVNVDRVDNERNFLKCHGDANNDYHNVA